MHQSHWRPLTQFSNLTLMCSGLHLIFLPASMKPFFKWRYFKNHWLEKKNSTVFPHLSCTLTECSVGTALARKPLSFKGSVFFFLASSVFRPFNSAPELSVILPLLSIAIVASMPYALYQSTSVRSPKVQNITSPVPLPIIA